MDTLIARLLSTLAALGILLPHAAERESRRPARILPVLPLVGLYAAWCGGGVVIMVFLLLSNPTPYRSNVAPAVLFLILWIALGSIWLTRLSPRSDGGAPRPRWLEPRAGPVDLVLVAAIAGVLGWALFWS